MAWEDGGLECREVELWFSETRFGLLFGNLRVPEAATGIEFRRPTCLGSSRLRAVLPPACPQLQNISLSRSATFRLKKCEQSLWFASIDDYRYLAPLPTPSTDQREYIEPPTLRQLHVLYKNAFFLTQPDHLKDRPSQPNAGTPTKKCPSQTQPSLLQSLRNILSTRSPRGPQKSFPLARLCSSMNSTYCLKLVLRWGSKPSSRITG
jgi:hypothetical protein